MKKSISKKIISGLLAATLIFGMNTVPAKAAAVTTSHHHSTATYNLYVRKSGSVDVLGIMTLSKDSNNVYTTFTASTNCGSTTTYVSQMDSSYSPKTATSVPYNTSLRASKAVVRPTNIYGYCTVNY